MDEIDYRAKLAELVSANKECVTAETLCTAIESTAQGCASGSWQVAAAARAQLPFLVIAGARFLADNPAQDAKA